MRKSIRTKVFWTFTSVVLGILILTVLLNTVFFKPFAIAQDKGLFRELEQTILTEASIGRISTETLSNLSAGYGVQLDILDRQTNSVLFSSSVMEGMSGMGHGRMRYRTSYGDLRLSDDSAMGFYQARSGTGDDVLMLLAPLNDETALVIYRPIEIIDRTVSQVNRFILMVGFILLAIGSAIIYWLAGRQVRPILALHEQTENMAKLDFSGRFESTSQDEVARLGENINAISDRLSDTINTLESDVQKLTEVDRVRKQFIATVSHEFKSPLGIIKGYTEALKYRLVSPEEEATYLDTIIDETDRMNRLVKDLIAQMKRELDQEQPAFQSVELCDFLDRVLRRHRETKPERNIQLECQSVRVLMDEASITQVLDNFLQNAYTYGDADGTIRVRTQLSQDGVTVLIENNGPRIPEDQRQAIWESFYKIDSSRTGQETGTGLGLAINKAIIERHGGTYGFHNLKNGVSFYFSLKRSNDHFE